MKTANQLPKGSYFVGTVDAEDFLASKFKRRPGGANARVLDGKKVSVVVVVEGDSVTTEDIMDIFARLPRWHTHQISNDFAYWLAGVRDTNRTDLVKVLNWTPRKQLFQKEVA